MSSILVSISSCDARLSTTLRDTPSSAVPRGRSAQDTVGHDEDVVRGAFGDVAVAIPQDRQSTGVDLVGLQLCEVEVHAAVVLDLGVEGFGVVRLRFGLSRPSTLRRPRSSRRNRGRRRGCRPGAPSADHARRPLAARREVVDVQIAHGVQLVEVAFDGLFGQGGHLFFRQPRVEADVVERAVEAS